MSLKCSSIYVSAPRKENIAYTALVAVEGGVVKITHALYYIYLQLKMYKS